jgi:chromosome segregation ATPase
VDHKNLKDTLVKSSLWKTNTLQRIENGRSGHTENGQSGRTERGQSGHTNESNDAVLQSLKRELLQVVERYWQDSVPNSDANSDQPLDDKPRASAVDDDQPSHGDTNRRREYEGMRETLTVHVKEAIKARRSLREQAARLQERNEQIERLQQTISQLKAENTSLTMRHQSELDGTRNQFFDLQAAYDQFQQQSDQLLTELDQENARLRAGPTH